jgi:hypothetical protein
VSPDFHDQLIVIDALEHNNWDRDLLGELRSDGVTAVHVTLAVWEDARTALDNIGHHRPHLRMGRPKAVADREMGALDNPGSP